MRFLSPKLDTESRALQALLDLRLLLRWVYAGRLAVTAATLLATVFQVGVVPASANATLLTGSAFAGVLVFTVSSAFYSETAGRRPATLFLFLQVLVDLLLVTLLVDITGAGESPLAALYIVVIAYAFLLLPSQAGIAATIAGGVLYAADIFLRTPTVAVLLPAALQLVVMALVAAFSHSVSGNLRRAGAGRAELAAELEHVKLQAADILRNIRSAIITIDAKGRLIQANPAAGDVLGIDFDKYLDKPVLSRIHEVSPDLAEMLIRTVKRPTRINRGEAAMPRNGETIPIGVTTTYAESRSGEPTSATAIFQDISETKRMELLSLRAERLTAVAELSASLAHEIKNPLASIRSAVEQLSVVQYAGEDERTLAALVQRESDRLARLLTEFLDFSRAQASSFRRLDVVALARGACELAESHPDSHFSVEIELNAAEPELDMDGDEDLLHRAIFNLVLNAAQASPASGRVEVRVGRSGAAHVPSLNSAGSEVIEIVVSDEGPGIPPEMRDRLFDPFFTTKAGGSGLGLSVVHRAITSHGGVVLVESGDGGTSFTILVPRNRPARSEAI